MSAFGDKLNELMSETGITSPVLADVAKISEGQISKLRNGLQTWVSPDHFAALANAISDREQVHAELLRAYLQDQCRGPGSHLINVTLAGRATTPVATPEWLARLPQDLQDAFIALIKEAEYDKDLRDVVYGMANLVAPERHVSLNEKEAAVKEVEDAIVQGLETHYGKKPRKKKSAK